MKSIATLGTLLALSLPIKNVSQMSQREDHQPTLTSSPLLTPSKTSLTSTPSRNGLRSLKIVTDVPVSVNLPSSHGHSQSIKAGLPNHASLALKTT